MDQQRPYNSGHTAIADMIHAIFGMVPGGQLLEQFLSPMISSWVMGNSPLKSFVWPSDGQTAGNAYYNYYNRLFTQQWSTSGAASTANTQALTAYYKATNPGKSPAEIANMVATAQANPFSIPGIMYSLMDPYGVNAGMPMMTSLATALQTRGAQFGLEGAYTASTINDALFGTNGMVTDIINNRAAYGGLDVGQVAAVGREVLNAGGGKYFTVGKDNKISLDAAKFKDAVQQMSQDIAPWTDIFGKDIPKLLTQLEALTGQSAALQTGALKTSAHRLLAVMNTTGASIQHIAAYRDALAPALIDPTGSARTIMGAHSIAEDMILGLSNTGLNTLTTQEFQQVGGSFFGATAKSEFTDDYSLAYAAWRRSEAGKNMATEAAAMDEFRKLYRDQLSRNGGNTYDALTSLAGVRSMADLDRYRNTDEYLASVKAGAGAAEARESSIRRAIAGFQSSNADTLNKLGLDSPDKIREFMLKSRNEQEKIIREKLGLDSHAALGVADTLLNDFRLTMNSAGFELRNEEEARAILQADTNYQQQNARAKERQTLMDMMSKLAPSDRGLSAVINQINTKGYTGDWRDQIKTYLGGDNLASQLVLGYLGDAKRTLTKEDRELISNAGQFIVDNYGALATTYKDIYDDFTGGDAAARMAAVKKFGDLQRASKPLGNLSTSERAAFMEDFAKLYADDAFLGKSDDERAKAVRQIAYQQRVKSMYDPNNDKADAYKKMGIDQADEKQALAELVELAENKKIDLSDTKAVRAYLEGHKAFNNEDDDKKTIESILKTLGGVTDDRPPIARLEELLEKIFNWLQNFVTPDSAPAKGSK